MAAYDDRLRNILSLAQEDSRENRNLLFRHLTDFYLQDHLPESERDRLLLDEIIGLVSGQVDVAVREDVALTLATMAHPPLALASLLAKDRIEVARPVLIAIPFSDQFLLDIIGATGPEHHAVLRERNGVSAEVGAALALAEHRDKEAARRLRASRRATAITEAAKTVAVEVKEAETPAREPAAPAVPSEIEVTPPPKPEPKAPAVTAPPTPPPPKRPARRRSSPLSSSKPGGLRPLLRRERPVPEGAWVFITDRNGRLEALSDEAEKAFGRTAASLRGADFFALLAPDLPAEFAEAVRRHRPLRDIEVAIENGQVSRWVLAASALFTLKDGQFEGYRGLARPAATPAPQAAPADEKAPPPKLLHGLAEDAGRHADRIVDAGRDIVKATKAKKTKRAIKQARRVIGEAEALRNVIETTVAAVEARTAPESAEPFDALPAVADALKGWKQERDDREIKVKMSKKSEATPIHFRRGLLARMTRAALDLANDLDGDGKMKIRVGAGPKGVARIVFPLPGDGLEFQDDDELPVRALRILRLLAEDAGGGILTRSDGKRITHLVFKLPLAEARQQEPARRAG